ncbi:MAG: hypothetical protein ACE5MK_00065 [Acidobacteriota bacterium]
MERSISVQRRDFSRNSVPGKIIREEYPNAVEFENADVWCVDAFGMVGSGVSGSSA